MNRKLLVMAAMGLASLLVMAGATADLAQDRRDAQAARNRPRVMINGKEDPNLSRSAVRVGDKVMVPARPFFQAVGSDVQQQRGWVRPGSRQPDTDRNEEWYVTQRDGRELRYRPGDRQYYYGGTPHYWSVAPYESDGSLYLSIGDLALTLGGRYNYNDRYNNGQLTLCEGGYCAGPAELRLTYPYRDGYYSYRDQVVVQGYAPRGATVRVQVHQQTSYPYQNRVESSQTMRTTNKGLFSVAFWPRVPGSYVATVDLLDDYGRSVNQQARRFNVR